MSTLDLLDVALNDPRKAEHACFSVLARSVDPEEQSIAHQALAVIRREDGRHDEALDHIRDALRFAHASGSRGRVADVRATYGATLVFGGSTQRGLRQLDRAVGEAPSKSRHYVLMRRASILGLLGFTDRAEADMAEAISGMRRSGQTTLLSRALNNLGIHRMRSGQLASASALFDEAWLLCEPLTHATDALNVRLNQAELQFLRGDLPSALARYAEIDVMAARSGRSRVNIAMDRCNIFRAAGLYAEALDTLSGVTQEALPATTRADLQLALAQTSMAVNDLPGALAHAKSARRLYQRQGRAWFETRAALVEVQSRVALPVARGLAARAGAVASALDGEAADEAPTALVLAGRLASSRDATRWYRAASRYRSHPSVLVSASGWLGQALLSVETRDRRGVLNACKRGLGALDEHRRTIGSSELRALATANGRDLADLAIRESAHDPRLLLRWSERWRATAIAQPPVTPAHEVSPALAMLRDNARQLDEARSEGEPTEPLERERRHLERAVRAEHHHRHAGRFDQSDNHLDVARLVDAAVNQVFVELVDVEGVLHVLVVARGRVRRRTAGSVQEALELAERGRFALRRAARGGSFDPGDLGQRLQDALLGDAVKLIPDGPVVIAPTVRLHGAPWALLPCLADRPFSLVPSAAQWLRARDVKKPRAKPLVLLSGPGLGSGGAEVPRLKRRNPDALLLRGRKATVEAALGALDGARLAHVAAHGHFRADSPLFSSLEMADGPLTVYELERLRRAPYRVVLSACESGVLAPVGAEELLGLAAALFSLGTAGMVSSIAEVRDDITADLMVKLHGGLAAGDDPATALRAVRRAAANDPIATATAAAFVALGV